MSKTIFRTLTLIAAIFLLSNTAMAQKTKTTQKAVIKTSIVCDHCKECGSCGGLLENTLLKTKGIQMITLDAEAETITVIYSTKKTDLPTIKSAISRLGYDADDVKADPKGYESLDGCCKKA